MSSPGRKKTYLVSAGEPSGDLMAAKVVDEVKKLEPESEFTGIGGVELEKRGVDLAGHIDDMAALGLLDSLANIFKWQKAYATLREKSLDKRVDGALLVDCPELNLRLARAVRRDGARVIQYVGPKVWAWRKERLSLLKERTDLVALVFDFEKEIYDSASVESEYVGHPLADIELADSGYARRKLQVDEKIPVVAMLPGSRKTELKRLGPVMVEASFRLVEKGICPVFAPLYSLDCADLTSAARKAGCRIWDEPVWNLLCGSDCAVAASGTVTLEAMFAKVPMVIVYKIDRASYLFAQYLVKVPFVGLPNLMAKKEVVPELLQDEVTCEMIVEHIISLLETSEGVFQKKEFDRLCSRLEKDSTSARVAKLLTELSG